MKEVLGGQYAYNFQRGHTKVKDVKKVLNHLKDTTGLFGFLDFKFPRKLKRVGSVDLKFGVRFKTAATKFLMRNRNKGVLEKASRKFINDYFSVLLADKENTHNICNRRTNTLIKLCKRRMIKRTKIAIAKMVKHLGEMSSLSGDNRKYRSKFAKSYNKFGQAMMESPFAFQAALNVTKGQGSDVYFSLETSDTRKHEAVLQFNAM